jgi:hypothetical protein
MANQVPAPPPYTPGFGRRRPVVAGRDALLDDVERVLEVGPEHPRFCRALLGGWCDSAGAVVADVASVAHGASLLA